MKEIIGVQFKDLVSHPDDRGFFRECIRVTDDFFRDEEGKPNPFAQWSHSKMGRNTVKAWHFHHRQIDWWYVGLGVLEVVLFDNRPESPTYQTKLEFHLGEKSANAEARESIVRIPQGVLHGAKVLSDIAHLFYFTSKTYDRNDEGRLVFNSPVVGHPWGKEEDLIVAANDRKEFIPPHPRVSFQ